MNRQMRTFATWLLVTLTACAGAPASESETSPGRMRVAGRELLDTNGEPVVARGINLQYGDHAPSRLSAIAPIGATGSNMIRLQLREHTTAEEAEKGIREAIRHRMLVMPFYWEDGSEGKPGTTCSNSPEALQAAARKWVGPWREVMLKKEFQPYLLVNIANEWGRAWHKGNYPMTYDEFIEHYSGAIKSLRAAGYKMPLVIDAPQCGQDYQAFTDGRGRRLLAADPEKNLLFSVHAYWRYRNAAEIDAAVAALEAENIAYLFGEFGNTQFQSTMDGGRGIDLPYLLEALQEKQRGWLAWSWYGNGHWEFQTTLDMSTAPDSAKLTPHGIFVVNGPKGIKKTSIKPRYWR